MRAEKGGPADRLFWFMQTDKNVGIIYENIIV